MKQLSKTVFFTVAGAVEQANTGSSIFALDLSREVSFSDFPEGNILAVHRAISRPYAPHEDEQLDFPSKKQKLEWSVLFMHIDHAAINKKKKAIEQENLSLLNNLFCFYQF